MKEETPMRRIITGRPPNFEAIVERFPLARNTETVFAYNGAIYTLMDQSKLPVYLINHECIHLNRQGDTEDSTLDWWENYLRYDEFRYHEELLGHVAEFKTLAETGNRQQRRGLLKTTIKRLTNNLYQFPLHMRQKAANDVKAVIDQWEKLAGG